ncbi:MAG: hypothetical protein IPF72_10355 [Chitinophagaceae bacterium]|nr:hypothetical protein [Chitinophagaceae bacterium]
MRMIVQAFENEVGLKYLRENNLKSKLSYTKVEADVIISPIKEVIKVEAVIQKLVIEFHEKQHTEADIFIDKTYGQWNGSGESAKDVRSKGKADVTKAENPND